MKLLSNEISVGGHLGSMSLLTCFILPRVNFCSSLFSLANHSDAPWCDIRPTHAGFKHVKTKFESRKKEKWENGLCVKGRNEPANIM